MISVCSTPACVVLINSEGHCLDESASPHLATWFSVKKLTVLSESGQQSKVDRGDVSRET